MLKMNLAHSNTLILMPQKLKKFSVKERLGIEF